MYDRSTWSFNTRTYQKLLNLFIYIPTCLLFERLIDCGHKTDNINLIFTQNTMKIDDKIYLPSKKVNKDNIPFNKRIFFHLPYHPRAISRLWIRNRYQNICESQDFMGNSFKHIPTVRCRHQKYDTVHSNLIHQPFLFH